MNATSPQSEKVTCSNSESPKAPVVKVSVWILAVLMAAAIAFLIDDRRSIGTVIGGIAIVNASQNERLSVSEATQAAVIHEMAKMDAKLDRLLEHWNIQQPNRSGGKP